MGAGIGGFIYWLGERQIAAGRRRFDKATERQARLREYENSVLEFSDAIVKEIDAATDAARMNAEIRVDNAGARAVLFARKTKYPDIVRETEELVMIPREWRSIGNNTGRTAILNGKYKNALSQIFERVEQLYYSEERTDRNKAA